MMMDFKNSKCALGMFALMALTIQTSIAVDYDREIRPILRENCLDCHGPDKAKAQLRVDQRASLLLGGDSGIQAVVPGNPSKSHLLDLIKGTDPDEIMPPKGDPLSKGEIALIEQWISEGAVWPGQMDRVAKRTSDHWSFQAVKRPQPPGDAKNPIDAFLNAKLTTAGIQANGPADARSLIRRVAVVLTGLPPTPERVHHFEKRYEENADQAYTDLVAELLDSKHFGERWAQHWLDVIRWAESNGSEANLYRKNAWLYRDYVVRAFNEDLPYDQFVREQIAGDTLGSGDATGFLVAGPHVPAATVGREPSAIRQARADRMDEIMQTVGASIMGVTIGCARCHNHKFDPITITDYYSMTGVFQDVEFGSRFPEFSQDHPRRKRGEEIWKEIARQRWGLAKIGGWEENWGAFREMHFKPVSTKAVRIRFKQPGIGLDELELFGTEDRNENLIHQRTGTRISGFPDKGFEGRHPISRLTDGEFGTMTWRVNLGKNPEEMPWVRFDFDQAQTIDRLRLSSNREYFYDTDYLDKKPYLPNYQYELDIMKGDGTWQPWVGTWVVNTQLDKKHPERKAALATIQKLIETLAEEGPRPSFVGRFVRPESTHVFHRGSPENPRDEVPPAAPAIFQGDLKLTSKAPGPKRRAEFAKWISSPQNPLTARVMVNRLWHHIFGNGIVTTTSDFGRAGAPPTHPELLEWLAAEFVTPTRTETGPWSLKGMIRLLVMSDAFKRSSLPDAAKLKVDAGAMLLWRFPPQRVSAEVLRDGILQASGKLDASIGGRSYRIHNEKKTYAQWEVVDNHGEQTWRRMLYQERMRRVDDQIFTAFDFPDCGQVRAKRPVSTTPLQALNLMNSDFVVEQSALIAQRATKEAGAGGLKSAVTRAFELLLTRRPDADELSAAFEIAKARGLNIVCRGLINANEFAFLP
jgi:mono/diheme cytochrome c family protein